MELYSFYILKKIHLTFFCAEFTKITELLRLIRTVDYNINLPLSIVQSTMDGSWVEVWVKKNSPHVLKNGSAGEKLLLKYGKKRNLEFYP